MTTRVMVFATVKAGEEQAFEAAFASVRANVAGTTGHLGDQLLCDRDTPGAYVLLSKWRSEEDFLAWENAPIHRQLTTPMRPHWAGAIERRIYHVVASDDTAGDDDLDDTRAMVGEATAGVAAP